MYNFDCLLFITLNVNQFFVAQCAKVENIQITLMYVCIDEIERLWYTIETFSMECFNQIISNILRGQMIIWSVIDLWIQYRRYAMLCVDRLALNKWNVSQIRTNQTNVCVKSINLYNMYTYVQPTYGKYDCCVCVIHTCAFQPNSNRSKIDLQKIIIIILR